MSHNDPPKPVPSQTAHSEIISRTIIPPGRKVNPRGAEIAPTLYAGLFLTQSGPYDLLSTSDYNTLQNRNSTNAQDGLSMTSFDVYMDDSKVQWYLAAWTKIDGGGSSWIGVPDWSSFRSTFDSSKSTSRLLDFVTWADNNGTQWFAGAWGGTPTNQTLIGPLNWNDFNGKVNSLASQGIHLIKVSVLYGQWYGLFEPTAGGYAFTASDWNDFYAFWQSNEKNLQLSDYEVYDSDGSRWYVGAWIQKTGSFQFVFDKDWGTFLSTRDTLAGQGLLLQKAIAYRNTVRQSPTPKWDHFFENALGSAAMGYAYCVSRNGFVLGEGVRSARAPQDSPQENWTLDTRMWLASVSKTVTAVSILKLFSDKNLSLDDPFYSLVKDQFPNVGPGVDTVTTRNLLQMKSGMADDGAFFETNLWEYLNTYLQAQNVPAGAPGNVSLYSNANFAILEAIIDCVTGHGGENPSYYPQYVNTTVFEPMGIDTTVFGPLPDPKSSSTLTYANASDTNPGYYFGTILATSMGGWVSSASQLIKFLAGIRNHTVLSAELTASMFQDSLGWYTYDGVFGQYYHHNGGLQIGSQGVSTGIIHLTDGFDCLLLVNSVGPNVIQLMVDAFEQLNG